MTQYSDPVYFSLGMSLELVGEYYNRFCEIVSCFHGSYCYYFLGEYECIIIVSYYIRTVVISFYSTAFNELIVLHKFCDIFHTTFNFNFVIESNMMFQRKATNNYTLTRSNVFPASYPIKMSLFLVHYCNLFQLQGDSVSFLFLLGTSFPAALLLKYIPSPTVKQVGDLLSLFFHYQSTNFYLIINLS